MSTSDARRPARGQSLPTLAVATLRLFYVTDYAELKRFAHHLYWEGWTLRSIAQELPPPVTKWTVRSWVRTADLDNFSRRSFEPVYRTPPVYVRTTPLPCPVSPLDASELGFLQSLAKGVRGNSPEHAVSRAASEALDILVMDLLSIGCSVQDIAYAADVSRKSMYARINRIKKAAP